MSDSPNVILIFGDQWRAQAFGYAGNSCVQTPNIDRLASQSINATQCGFGVFGLLPGAGVSADGSISADAWRFCQ